MHWVLHCLLNHTAPIISPLLHHLSFSVFWIFPIKIQTIVIYFTLKIKIWTPPGFYFFLHLLHFFSFFYFSNCKTVGRVVSNSWLPFLSWVYPHLFSKIVSVLITYNFHVSESNGHFSIFPLLDLPTAFYTWSIVPL